MNSRLYSTHDPILLTLSLFSVTPGRDRQCSSDLLHAYPNAILTHVFGRHDFLLLARSPVGPLPDTYLRTLPYIRDAREIVCARLGPGSVDLPSLYAYPFLSVVFLKLHPAQVRLLGPTAPGQYLQTLLQALRKAVHPQPSIIGLSSLGWHETIAVIGSHTFLPLLHVLPHLSPSPLLPTAHEPDGSDLQASQSSSPISGIIGIQTIISTVLSHEGDVSEAPIDLALRVDASLYPFSAGTAIEAFRHTFQSISFATSMSLGSFDLSFTLPSHISAHDYVSSLWAFRSATSNQVKWTSTTPIAHAVATEESKGLPTGPLIPTPSVGYPLHLSVPDSNPHMALLARLRHHDYERLSETIRFYNAIGTDAQLGMAHAELHPFLTNLVRTFDEGAESSEVRQAFFTHPNFLGEQLNLLNHALAQRLTGSPLRFLTLGEDVPGFATGIQNALLGAAYVVRSILRSAGHDWSGFIIAGYSGYFHRYHGGIIDIPFQALVSPESWWRLFYEAGREFAFCIRLTEHAVVQEVLHRAGLQHFGFERFDELAWQMFADVFAIEFGIGCSDWSVYRTLMWHSTSTQDDDLTIRASSFLRWLLVSIYCNHRRGVDPPTSQSSIAVMAQELRANIASHRPEIVELPEDFFRQATTHALRLESLVTYYMSILRSLGSSPALKISENAKLKLARGQLLDEYTDPVGIIVHSMTCDAEIAWPQRWATMMSLWAQAVQARTD